MHSQNYVQKKPEQSRASIIHSFTYTNLPNTTVYKIKKIERKEKKKRKRERSP
jgi:hypothetical protein